MVTKVSQLLCILFLVKSNDLDHKMKSHCIDIYSSKGSATKFIQMKKKKKPEVTTLCLQLNEKKSKIDINKVTKRCLQSPSVREMEVYHRMSRHLAIVKGECQQKPVFMPKCKQY